MFLNPHPQPPCAQLVGFIEEILTLCVRDESVQRITDWSGGRLQPILYAWLGALCIISSVAIRSECEQSSFETLECKEEKNDL